MLTSHTRDDIFRRLIMPLAHAMLYGAAAATHELDSFRRLRFYAYAMPRFLYAHAFFAAAIDNTRHAMPFDAISSIRHTVAIIFVYASLFHACSPLPSLPC